MNGICDKCKGELFAVSGDCINCDYETESELSGGAGCSTAELKAPVPELEGTYPVVLYFGNDADREEFIAVMAEVMPNAVAKKL